MALNRVREECNQISLPVPSGTVSGDPVAVGELNGVALTDRDAWTPGEATVQLDGSFAFTLTGAIAAGAAVTRDTVNAKGDASGSGTFGHAVKALGAGVTDEVEVRLKN